MEQVAEQLAVDNRKLQPPEVKLKIPCRGEVVIGPDDPRNMSLEEFKSSPHLLYHGTLFHFQIDRNWTHYTVNENSSLISGSGFYTTSSREEAENYSSIRQSPPGAIAQKDVTPVVLEVMPYQAKMYDFTTGNSTEPGAVSEAFLREFISFLRSTPEQGIESQPVTTAPAWLQELNKRYSSWQREYSAEIVENISKGMVQNVPAEITINQLRWDDYKYLAPLPETGMEDLDQMERELNKDYVVDSDGRYRTKDGKYIVDYTRHNYMPYAELLRLFLQSKGYDGLISGIRGDNEKLQKPHLEYVFFPGSLNKIGTYDQWKQEKDSKTSDTS